VAEARADVEVIILDACCSLNLYATGRMDEILGQLPYRFCVGRRARAEAQWLRVPDAEEREQVDLEPLLQATLLEELVLQAHEEACFVELAKVIADGEAEAGSLAVSRGCALATDDRKARRIIGERWPSLRLLGTLELLREWQETARPTDALLAEILRRISERATYRPRSNHPLWPWWHSLLGE
jgi:predicted nucleic acid-binding protein